MEFQRRSYDFKVFFDKTFFRMVERANLIHCTALLLDSISWTQRRIYDEITTGEVAMKHEDSQKIRHTAGRLNGQSLAGHYHL